MTGERQPMALRVLPYDGRRNHGHALLQGIVSDEKARFQRAFSPIEQHLLHLQDSGRDKDQEFCVVFLVALRSEQPTQDRDLGQEWNTARLGIRDCGVDSA